MRAFSIPAAVASLVATFVISLTVTPYTASAANPEARPCWQLDPYRVRILVGVDPQAGLSRRFQERLLADLGARAEGVVGGAWRTAVAPAPAALRFKMLADLQGLTAIDAGPTTDLDKLILLSVGAAGGGYRVQAREFDVLTRSWNAVVTAQVQQSVAIGAESFRAVLAAFAPLARIEEVAPGQVTLRLRAGAIPRRDSSLAAPPRGSVFRPVVGDGEVSGKALPESLQFIPWTYLRAEKVEGAVARCRVVSSLQEPVLPEYHALRQRLALAVLPPNASTRLLLRTGGETGRPLEGYEVFAESFDGRSYESLGMTNRQGWLDVPPSGDGLRMLVVKHGDAVLARAPLVPGLAREVVLALPDDSRRLKAEGLVNEVRDRLIDLVLRREVLAARARALIKAGEREKAGPEIAAIAPASSTETLAARIDQLRQQFIAGEAAADPRLERLFADARRQLLAADPKQLLADLDRELNPPPPPPKPVAPATPAAPATPSDPSMMPSETPSSETPSSESPSSASPAPEGTPAPAATPEGAPPPATPPPATP